MFSVTSNQLITVSPVYNAVTVTWQLKCGVTIIYYNIIIILFLDEQCSCIWRTVNSSVKRTARRSFVSHTHTQTHTRARAEKIQSERVFHNMQNWRATCKRYSLLYFPVKLTEFLWNSSAFKNSASGRSLLRKRQSHWPALTYYRPCFDFSESFERTHTTWLIFMNPAAH